jgi:tRNA (uracil-5-)-methyltransferase TRM9
MMKDYLSDDAIQESWDTIADSFHKTRQKPWETCLTFISTLPKDAVVGDFGCGNGRHIIEIARSCKKVIGIDISYNLLRIIHEKIKSYQNIDLIHGNLKTLPLQDNSLNAILFIASLHNIPKRINRIQSLCEAFRVLKPGGDMLLSVWNLNKEHINTINDNIDSLNIDKESIEPGDVFIYWKQEKLHTPRYYHCYNKKEIISEVKKAGFHIDSFQDVQIASKIQPDNYFLTLKKES